MVHVKAGPAEMHEPDQGESILLAERRSLEMIAGGAGLCDILTDTCQAWTIASIAVRLGFADQSHFTRLWARGRSVAQ
jgi:AraC-like DNA-binding protein